MVLRRAVIDDLRFILDLERTFCALGFVGADDIAVHQRQLSDSDCLYSIVETDRAPAGFVILRGLASVNRSVELKRIVIAEPGRGLGRVVLRTIMDQAFNEFSAHRLWLDVYDDNHRARSAYRAVGFVEEGTLRECIERGGEYRSLVVMSILEPEYRRLFESGHRASNTDTSTRRDR